MSQEIDWVKQYRDATHSPRYSSDPHRSVKIEVRQIEDWVSRLTDCANEAHDERLVALESDLLDLRRELLEFTS